MGSMGSPVWTNQLAFHVETRADVIRGGLHPLRNTKPAVDHYHSVDVGGRTIAGPSDVCRVVDFQKLKTIFRYFIIIACYYTIGCVFFSFAEGWSTLDSCFFITVSITTCGYVSCPHTTAGKIFAMFFVLFGICNIFSHLIIVAQTLMEREEPDAVNQLTQSPTAAASNRCMRLGCAFALPCLWFTVGAFMVHFLEGFTAIDSVWWSFQTISTVGYGDLHLQHNATRVFTIVFLLVSAAMVAVEIGNIGAIWADMQLEKKNREIWKRLDVEALSAMDRDGDGVSCDEFVVSMLQILGVVDEKKVENLRAQFHSHDADNSGRLTREDLVLYANEKARERNERLRRPTKHKASIVEKCFRCLGFVNDEDDHHGIHF